MTEEEIWVFLHSIIEELYTFVFNLVDSEVKN